MEKEEKAKLILSRENIRSVLKSTYSEIKSTKIKLNYLESKHRELSKKFQDLDYKLKLEHKIVLKPYKEKVRKQSTNELKDLSSIQINNLKAKLESMFKNNYNKCTLTS